MSASTPRLRMFAGPNGSGKSTINEVLPPQLLGIYVNADEMEKAIRAHGFLDLAPFQIATNTTELQAFVQASGLLAQAKLLPLAQQLTVQGTRIIFGTIAPNSYWASVLADFIRHKLLQTQRSFTFETVMSSPDKVNFLHKAQQAGYRTYLYFVATEDADINVSRVQHRVAMGGHPVPEEKIRQRYTRSLALLADAVTYANRAYIFDNSGTERLWVAEVTEGQEIEMKTDQMPAWFKTALWDRFE